MMTGHLCPVVTDCQVGGQPAPGLEYALNRILTRTRGKEQVDFRAQGYRAAVAREARVGHSTVCRYFAGEAIGYETKKRIVAALRRMEVRH